MSEIIYLSNVRLSFPHLVEPQTLTNQKTGKVTNSYNADFVMAPDHAGYQQFLQRYMKLAQENWKENATPIMGIIQSDRKSRCFGSGAEKINKNTFQPYDGYVNMVYITASSKDRMPQLIQSDGKPVDALNTMACQALARSMYAGCYVNAAIKPWIQRPGEGYSHGIRCDLIAIQFAADGEAFGEGAPDATPLFGAVASQAAPSFPGASMPAAPFPGFMMPGQ